MDKEKKAAVPHPGSDLPDKPGTRRDPEDRPTRETEDVKEKTLDKTLADSFPTSDPPSTIPDPGADEDEAA